MGAQERGKSCPQHRPSAWIWPSCCSHCVFCPEHSFSIAYRVAHGPCLLTVCEMLSKTWNNGVESNTYVSGAMVSEIGDLQLQ